ncbi:L-threonylcarbamoyladenylate synthase [Gymnodinialimonas sp. 2305UL16-5]|uniref:L-threonylcarbamoyladenylate synthase n=1 Tax=Gymnodinialimonas mytili TaxID=3126503 RepID=UPI0030A4523F
MSPSHPEILHNNVKDIARVAELLRAGGLVGLPTETVYGLAADARNPQAVARIFAAKGRPTFNPLIVHLPDLGSVTQVAELGAEARVLAEAFWPGPMTLVLPSRGVVADLVSGGLATIAVRVPAHPLAQQVLKTFGGPIAAPSANPSGQISPTMAQHVVNGLSGKIDAVLDAGPCDVGLESTILAPGPDGLRLLREGGIAREQIEAVAGPLTSDLTPGRVEAPGQMERHYATKAPLHLGGIPQPGEISVGFGPGSADMTLSDTGDLTQAAANLFAILHQADALATERNASGIRIASIPETGLGAAINDRLRRAAIR